MASMASASQVGCRVASSTGATGSGRARRGGSTPRALARFFRKGVLASQDPRERVARAVVRVVPRAVLDDEGVPWDADVDLSDLPAPPAGLSYDEATPGATLPELAARLLDAVRAQYKDTMYDECVVDMSPFGVEECSGDLHEACAEVAVAANSAQVAGEFNMAMRRRELRRLRAALWEMRKMLEAAPGTVLHHRAAQTRASALGVAGRVPPAHARHGRARAERHPQLPDGAP